MSNIHLKSCPHCGGDARVKHESGVRGITHYIWVECDRCHAMTQQHTSDEDTPLLSAVNEWNRRVLDKKDDKTPKPLNVTVLPTLRIVHNIADEDVDMQDIWDKIEEHIIRKDKK